MRWRRLFDAGADRPLAPGSKAALGARPGEGNATHQKGQDPLTPGQIEFRIRLM